VDLAQGKFDREAVGKIFRDYCTRRQVRRLRKSAHLQFKIVRRDVFLVEVHPAANGKSLWEERSIARFTIPPREKKWKVYTMRDGKTWTEEKRFAGHVDIREALKAFDQLIPQGLT